MLTFLLLLLAFHSPEKVPCPEHRFTQSLGRIISQKTSVTIQAQEVMFQNVMLVIMHKIASIQDVIKKHLPLFTSIDAIILSSVNPMTLCNLEKVVREQSLTTITINIPCSQEPLQELVLSIVEMPTCIHTTDNNQIARGEWMPRSTASSSNLNL